MKSVTFAFMATLILTAMLTFAHDIRPVRASGTIHIQADGSIDPPTANITTADNVTYTFTDNNHNSIVVERDSVIIDGAGYALEGSGNSTGLSCSEKSNVTVRNLSIRDFHVGIYLNHSSDNRISGNNITANDWCGIHLVGSSSNEVSGNHIADNGDGIRFYFFDDYNNISGNNIATNDFYGIYLYHSLHNSISRNNITDNNLEGIYLLYSSSSNVSENTFADDGLQAAKSYHNSIENNTVNGRPLVYLEGVANHTIDEAGQVVLVQCRNITVENLSLSRTAVGIELFETDDSTISGNTIADSGHGIILYNSSNNSLQGNHIAECHRHGIWLVSSSNNSVWENTFTEDGLHVQGSFQNMVKNNTVNGKPLVYLEDVSNRTVEDAGQVILVRCENITTTGLNLSRTTVGIELWETVNSTISENYIADNSYGIGLYWVSSNNNISANIIANNEYSIRLSDNNRIFHNNFINNTNRLETHGSVNTWDDGYPQGGNYWSDYTGADLYCGPHQNVSGSDGVGDTPYVIDEANQDNYPLMKPYPWNSHDIGIVAVEVSRTVVMRGQHITVNTTVFNYGNHSESFNVTVHANGTVIGLLENVALASRNSTALATHWDTISFAKGNFTITIHVTPVSGEIDISDNTFTGWAVISIPGDVDGDRDVDIFDIVLMASGYGTLPSNPKYRPNCDVDGDGYIGIFDIVIAADHYGDSW